MTGASDQTLHMNCTQCGVGLDVLGGGRVKTHVCSYCGAELDAQDDYKVIQQFRDMQRPETPFDLGMTGQLWGVDFTIIGTIAWTEYFGGKRWSWVDHQIYSPTHGYAWLTVDNGYVTYTRKTHDVPTPATLSHAVIETSETRPRIRFQGETFSYYGSGKTSPTFIEGAFNFRPQLDDVVNYVELMGGERMLGILESGQPEREYEISELPDQASVLDSFGVEPRRRPKPRGTHPLDAIERTPIQAFIRNLALVGSAAAVMMAIGLSAVGEKVAQSGRPSVQDGITLPFEITTYTGLTQITLFANATNSWAWFEGELTDENDEPVAEFERGIEYYKGSDWSEGSRTAHTRLTLEPGAYTLYLSMVEGEQDYGAGQVATVMSVEVYQGVANTFWMWIVAGFLGLIGFLFLGQRFLRRASRWSGSDWSDD